jgi:hypothetical protein
MHTVRYKTYTSLRILLRVSTLRCHCQWVTDTKEYKHWNFTDWLNTHRYTLAGLNPFGSHWKGSNFYHTSLYFTQSKYAVFIRCHIYCFFPLALQPSAGYDLIVSWGFLITQNDAPQSVGPLWASDRHIVAETSTWQHTTHTTNIHSPGGIRTHNRSRRAAVDLRLRLQGQWDRPIFYFFKIIDVQHAGLINNYQKATCKALKTKAAVWFNKVFRK